MGAGVSGSQFKQMIKRLPIHFLNLLKTMCVTKRSVVMSTLHSGGVTAANADIPKLAQILLAQITIAVNPRLYKPTPDSKYVLEQSPSLPQLHGYCN